MKRIADFDPGVPPLVPTAGKEAWRVWARSRRRTVDLASIAADVIDHLAGYPGWQAASTVLTYLAKDDEIDLAGLHAATDTRRFAATRTPLDGPLSVHRIPAEMEQHSLGFRQPVAGTPEVGIHEIDVVLIPGLAFDIAGRRLGRGGGHYDELLARLPDGVPRVGVTPSALVTLRLPEDDWDRHVSHLATELGVWEVSPVHVEMRGDR